MKRTARMARIVLGTCVGMLVAFVDLTGGSIALESGYTWQGITIIMLSLYVMLLVHAFIITTRIKDLLEEKREQEGAGPGSHVEGGTGSHLRGK
jgi:hypothetical protein